MTYQIHTGNQAGTTWYHAHYKAEYVDGFWGPLIIRDPYDPHRDLYDEELVITLNDHYHQDTSVLLKDYLNPKSEGNEPIPDAGLINGKGRYDCNRSPNRASCHANAPRENFNFVPGKRYRLRIINTSAFSTFKFSIDGHKLTVIESDMVNLEPVMVDRLNINVAQRYSVIVQANQRPDNYWMRAIISTACFPTAAPNLDRNVLARVHYQGAPNGDPTTRPVSATPNADTDCVDLDPRLLKPLQHHDAHTPTHTINLDVSFSADTMGINRGHFNNVSFVPDFSNSMLETVTSGSPHSFKRTDNVYQVPLGAEVRIILNNFDGGEHPFHLHGYEFQVLAWATGTYDPRTSPLNLRNPVRRDTSTVPANGYTVLQFKADNLGIWAFHCHIEWHVLSGLVMLFQTGTKQQLAQGIHVPGSVTRMCKNSRHAEQARAIRENSELTVGAARARAQGFPKAKAMDDPATTLNGPANRQAAMPPRMMREEGDMMDNEESGLPVTSSGAPASLADTSAQEMNEEYLA